MAQGSGVRVLVCGSRTYAARETIYSVLDSRRPSVVMHGMAVDGADRIADDWAMVKECPVQRYRANWRELGKRAGPLRNIQMLEEGKPDLVLAFVDKPLHESRGTAHMVKVAREAGIPVEVFETLTSSRPDQYNNSLASPQERESTMLDSVQVSQATNTAAMQATDIVTALIRAQVIDGTDPGKVEGEWALYFSSLQPIILEAHNANQEANKVGGLTAAFQGSVVVNEPVVPHPADTTPVPNEPTNVVPFAQPAAIPGATDGDPQLAAFWTDFFTTPDHWTVKKTNAGKTFIQHKYQNAAPDKNGKIWKQSLWLDGRGNPSWVAGRLQAAGIS